ncbi:MAG: hypothetical protein Q9219_006565 [cf. Caloplaca sp. 3 TL-2023]
MAVPGYAIVTGAGSGLGRGIAFAFAAAGSAGVLLADIDQEAAGQVAEVSKTASTDPNYRAIPL